MTQGWDIADAQSYLAALEGPEVKALVEALEIHSSCNCEYDVEIRKKALSQYREAVKK